MRAKSASPCASEPNTAGCTRSSLCPSRSSGLRLWPSAVDLAGDPVGRRRQHLLVRLVPRPRRGQLRVELLERVDHLGEVSVERLVGGGESAGGLALPAGHQVAVEARELRLLPAHLGDGVFHLLCRGGHGCPVNGRLGCHSSTSLCQLISVPSSVCCVLRSLLLPPRSRPGHAREAGRSPRRHPCSIYPAGDSGVNRNRK